ncbi:MAG: hypothetical protein FWD03_02265 [Defluviitaleaceae bacterium]|nr:hypothetical protein [Defluviitaleaceae bacterium]
MKKIPIVLGLIALALTLAACNASADDPSTAVQIPVEIQSLPQTITDIADAVAADFLEDIDEGEAPASIDEGEDLRYTFGDSFTLWERYQVSFASQPIFFPVDRDALPNLPEDNADYIWRAQNEGNTIVAIPVTLTRLTEERPRLFTQREYTFRGPTGGRLSRAMVAGAMQNEGRHDAERFQMIQSVPIGEAIEYHIHFMYEGDGTYTFIHERFDQSVYFEFPIIMP